MTCASESEVQNYFDLSEDHHRAFEFFWAEKQISIDEVELEKKPMDNSDGSGAYKLSSLYQTSDEYIANV